MVVNNLLNSKKYYFSDTAFKKLMQKRIYHVLIICSNYDYFMLEEDGRIDEQIFNEYVSLNLRYPPMFIHATDEKSAFEILNTTSIDLIITMLSVGDPFLLAKKIKSNYASKPIVVLTPFSREISLRLDGEDMSAIDYVFSWLGDTEILLAIIKLLEDKMNISYDIEEAGVQAILLVEDSIRFYSSNLPNIYKIVFKQSRGFMSEGLNEHQKTMRMRGRPKILLARNYEEAISIYEKYKNNLLGIISDMNFKRNGVFDAYAGKKLCETVKNADIQLPFLLHSSELKNKVIAENLNVSFLYKHSKTFSKDLKTFMNEYMAFGDFVFRNPETNQEIARVHNLKALQKKIFEIPDYSLKYHISRNHFSKWLNARALFPLAEMFKPVNAEDFNNLDEVRHYLYDAIMSFRINKGRGIIADFDKDRFDEYFIFSRIGDGSLGGKARGLAFIDSLIKRNKLFDKFEKIIVTIPLTVVLTSDVFDEFMENNNLYKFALSDYNDEIILNRFIKAKLPERIYENLKAFIKVVKKPIAVRSSSLLEDSHYQPFAGIYSTYMIPVSDVNFKMTLEMLCNAIKSVYASVYFKSSKAYMEATSNIIDEEKMAVVLQEVCGRAYKGKFYPVLSGVARSNNFYPILPEKPEEGIVNLAFGLGKYIVEGGTTLRFSPYHPNKIIQLSSPKMALRETQQSFYALDLNCKSFKPSVDDNANILKLKIDEAKDDGTLRLVTSTYDMDSNMLRDGFDLSGRKVVTFSNILNYNTFPLADILKLLLNVAQKEMNNHIEIEFAVDMDVPSDQPKVFYLLQIRPVVDNKEKVNFDFSNIKKEQYILKSEHALGNGIINGLKDIVYVKPDVFDASNNPATANIIGKLNDSFLQSKTNYILIGPGRWGSSDPWLGIPVKWPQISAARLLVESSLESYRIDPSQGTHFFHNLTSFRVGYFAVNPYINDGYYNVDYLNSLPAIYEDEFVRHVCLSEECQIIIDGKNGSGVVILPR